MASNINFFFLQIDEIYVKKKVDYKNGKLYGFAENDTGTEAARTIVGVLISSAFGNFKDVVSLTPVIDVKAEQLTRIVEDSCLLLDKCGFIVVIIIADNNKVNQKLFQNLCGKGNFQVDLDNGFITLCTNDSVHIAKCLRNNWVNQRDFDKTFCYPCFNDFSRICFAKFSVLRAIYAKESGALIKTAPRLNYKTVYPSTIERQKVSLALNIWHESTIAAVKKYTDNESDQTAAFLEIIWKWWNIMNIKNTVTHVLKRNDHQRPFTSILDDRLVFLERFLDWLNVWKPVPKNGGFLTEDTFTALHRQTTVMVRFIKYALTELKVPYVLPGKVQTDLLEKRFSKYRNLSGNNYNISVVQVCSSINNGEGNV